jgi:GTP-binding protein
LSHIERNSTLLFLVPVDTQILGEYDILVNELTKYNPEMLDKERLLVISKCDMLDDELTAELKN